MGLQMHAAPRWLGMMGCVGGLIQPLRSVLPGCILSIPLTRVYLMEKVQGMVDQHPEVRFSLYVDDAVQICTGAAAAVASQLAMAA